MYRREIIAETHKDWANLIGISYALGGQDRLKGLNCYGLVREVYKGINITLPVRNEMELSAELVQKEGANWEKIVNPEPYAVALMRSDKGLHLGIITPDMQLLRCDENKGVIVSRLKKYNYVIISYYRYKAGGGETLPIAGGGSIGRAIGGLLVAVAAFVFPPMIATGVWGAGWAGLGGWALAGAIGASMAISIVGSMVVDSLFPIPSPETPSLSGWDNNLKDSRHYTWDGIVNDHRPGLAKSWLFGTMKVGGQIISEHTSYDANGNEFFNMLICPVAHRITRLDDVRINDTENQYYDQVQVALRPGDDEQSIIDTFRKIYTQYLSGAKIRYDASADNPTDYTAFTSKKDITGCRFVISAPRGLYEIVSNSPQARSVVFRIQYKKHTEETWNLIMGDYSEWVAGNVTNNTSGFTGRIWRGFDTDINTTAIKFRLISYHTIDETTTFTWSRYRVYYRKEGASSWILHGTYEVGACYYGYLADGSWNIVISGLEIGKYQVRINWENDCCTNLYGTHNINAFAVDNVYLSTQAQSFTVSGNAANPLEAVTKIIELLNLEEDTYNFRIWRTTVDQTSIYWCDDIFLKTYSEIITDELAYPNHSLIGVSAMATDRLSGSRPKITAIGIGQPLSVPPAEDRYDTTVYADEGIVTGTGNTVNNVLVDGMRKILINAQLPNPSAPSIFYYWLVRMDSPGFAQPDRLLTKYFNRVHTWEIDGTRTRLYLQSTEGIPAGTQVMVFYENYAPTDSYAWAIAKVLIEGSHGRITTNHIEWESFAEFDEYCNELVDSEQRHKFDAVIDFSEDLWGLVTRIVQQASAQIVPYGNKYKIIIDKPINSPVQVFGEGNTKNVHVYPIPQRDRANVLVIAYLDENLNYDEKTISEEDIQPGEYPIVKTLSPLVGITRESEARRYLRRLLKYNRYIDHEIEFEAGSESIEVEVGDCFAFQSQVNDFASSGRIRGTNDAGDKVVLDKSIEIESGVTYRLRVWGADGVVYTWEGVLTGDSITEVPKPTGLTIDNNKPYECNYILAKTSEINTMYRTKSIKRSAETMFSTIRGIVYRDEVYS
ncbi:MAG TPA: hypothetical protein DDW17_09995 [Deltaproteobacteria bacterium]|nr:hypothetical protein [Deltaproteobacteria bacterium]